MLSLLPEYYIDRLREVYALLHDAWITLKLKRMTFQAQYQLTAHDSQGGWVLSHNIFTICHLRQPTNVIKLQSLLDLCIIFHRYVRKFQIIVAPLFRKLPKREPTHLGTTINDESLTLATMKENILYPCSLALPPNNRKYTIDTGSCDQFVECQLLQQQPKWYNKTIGYWSRSLTTLEQSSGTTYQ